MRQREFKFKTWGGKRRGAGAKPKGPRSRVGHDTRAEVKARFPVHVTLRVREGIELRKWGCLRVLKEAFLKARKETFQVVHYSIQGNHMHLIVEAGGTVELSRGMQGLNVRVARALNRLLGLKGRIFEDRYHAQIVKSPKQARSTVRYVLRNYEKHIGRVLPREWRDPFASAGRPIAGARTWLLANSS